MNEDRWLIPQPSHEFTVPQVGQNRILVEMIETTLATAREIAPANVDLDQLVREGKRIQSGRGLTTENIQAFKLFYEAATAGHSEAQFLVCKCYDFGRGVEADKTQYLSWLRKSAESGFAKAQNSYGLRTKDRVEAAMWFRKAAIQGSHLAQNRLGGLYQRGEGVERNDDEAVRWWRKAAMQGNEEAQYNLGLCYAKGQGVPQDDEEAVKWWRKTAVQCFHFGLYELGICYSHGRGVPRDLVEGYKWLRLSVEYYRRFRQEKEAVSEDENEALAKAVALEALMSPSEIEAALALCRNFRLLAWLGPTKDAREPFK